jgi:cell division septation protein DedD
LRAALFLLVFANLAFFGWSHLVDVAPEPMPDDSIQHVPKLKLLNEVQSPAGAQASPTAQNPPAPLSMPPSSSSAQAPARTSSSSAPGPSSTAPVGPSGSSAGGHAPSGAAAPLARNSERPRAPQRCVTVGPFNDSDRVDEAADLLAQRGFRLHERAAQSAEVGYWVYVGGLKSDSDQSAVVRRLQQNGVADAHVMPDSDKGRRVSVGFFAEHDGAERRARAVRGLGLKADIEKRTQSAATHWVDVDLDSSTQSLPTEGLLSLQEAGSRLEIKECPSGDRVAGHGELSAKAVAEASTETGTRGAIR